MNPEEDVVTFYTVSSSTNAEGYAKAITKGSMSYFIIPVCSKKRICQNYVLLQPKHLPTLMYLYQMINETSFYIKLG